MSLSEATPGANRIPAHGMAAPDADTPRFSRRVTIFTLVSVLLVMMLASLDQTIVGTALPRIAADLNGTQGYTAVTTAYLLTSTVMVPIYGKLSDLIGRKPIMIFALSIFLVGSALAGTSQTMTMLIGFRGFQGLGGGGLIAMATAIIGDLFSPRARARWQGLLGAIFGATFILGPTAGGYITDYFSWRWVFYVNLPLGVLALLALIFLMPTLRQPMQGAKIDVLGAILLIAGVVPLLLGFNWAGSQYAWNSPQTIGLLTGAAVVLAVFFLYEAQLERRGAQPMIEPSLFRHNAFAVSVLVTMLSSVALIGSISFIPLFIQGIVGSSATNSGAILTPLMLTAIAASIISGVLVSAFGRYKAIAVVGGVIAAVGAATLLQLGVQSTDQDVVVSMLVLGLGIGFSLSLYNLVVQNAFPTKIGQATAGLTFFRQIGSTIGLAAMGSLLSSTYNPVLPASVASQLPVQLRAFVANPFLVVALPQLQSSLASQGPQGQALYNSIAVAMKAGVAQSLHALFVMSLIVSIASVVALLFLKEIPLSGRSNRLAAALAGEVPAPAEIDAQL
jgi:EmrB/QacA subfamily drug resistance transporter